MGLAAASSYRDLLIKPEKTVQSVSWVADT